MKFTRQTIIYFSRFIDGKSSVSYLFNSFIRLIQKIGTCFISIYPNWRHKFQVLSSGFCIRMPLSIELFSIDWSKILYCRKKIVCFQI